jgi:hypothetical protein
MPSAHTADGGRLEIGRQSPNLTRVWLALVRDNPAIAQRKYPARITGHFRIMRDHNGSNAAGAIEYLQRLHAPHELHTLPIFRRSRALGEYREHSLCIRA